MKCSNLKKLFVLILTLVICFSLLPVSAFAYDLSDQSWIFRDIYKYGGILTLAVAMKPVITTYPASKTIVEGNTAKFGVKVTGEELSYQWQYRTGPNGTWKNSNARGSKTEKISFTAHLSQSGYQYRCKVTNSEGTVYTNAATLTVVTIPTIATHPATKTVTVGNTAKFGVVADGGDLKYQWQYRTGANGTWENSNATGNNTKTMSFTVKSNQNGYQFRCKVTNKAGTVYTKVATLNVKVITPLTIASGKSGSLVWTLDSNGKLAFFGQGNMADYNYSYYPPWYEYKTLILTVLVEDGVTSIGDYAFLDCSGLTNVMIPDSVTSIGESAFENCSGLINMVIPDSVTSIGEWAFYNCSRLTSVTIPNSVTSIPKGLFNGCSSLISVKIPNGVTNIQSGAFYGCSGLTSISIPNSVKSVEGWAFYDCSSLKSVTIPESITNIDRSAFNGCSGLQTIIFSGSSPNINNTAFRYVTATAYYPPDQGWADSVVQNYGGTLTWIVVTPPVITTHPASKVIAEGDTVKFGVAASGIGVSYQWQYRTDPTGIWENSNAVGSRTKKMSFTASFGKNGYQYRCKVTNKAGTVYTNVATLTVGTPPVITTHPASKTAAKGSTVKFGMVASGDNLSYQWEYRTSPSGAWTDSSAPGNNTVQISITARTTQNGYQYRCKVTNNAGTVYTNPATLTVK